MSVLAAPFKYQNVYDDKIQEYNIKFNKDRNSLDKLLEFIELYENKRINIEVSGDYPTGSMVSISKLHPNVYLRLKGTQLSEVPQLREKGCRFFFSQDNCAYNYLSLESLVSMGVTDVYPADDLLYNIQETRDYCDGVGINLRLVLNNIPSSTLQKGLTYKDPIFPPNALPLLEEYIDVFEFNCGDHYDWNVFDVLYRTWFEKGYWYGDLQEINNDLSREFPCMAVPQEYVKFKLKCDRRCDKRENPSCHKCDRYLQTSLAMAEKGIFLKNNKNMVNSGEES